MSDELVGYKMTKAAAEKMCQEMNATNRPAYIEKGDRGWNLWRKNNG